MQGIDLYVYLVTIPLAPPHPSGSELHLFTPSPPEARLRGRPALIGPSPAHAMTPLSDRLHLSFPYSSYHFLGFIAAAAAS